MTTVTVVVLFTICQLRVFGHNWAKKLQLCGDSRVGKVLAVDDDVIALAIIERALTAYAIEVVSYADPEEAWAYLQLNPDDFDVILLDRIMPKLDGMEFVGRVKAEPRLRHIPIVMQTVEGDPGRVAEGIAAGVYYYLPKPTDPKVLRTVIDAAALQMESTRSLRSQLATFQSQTQCLQFARYTFRTLEEARNLSKLLSSLYPDPLRVATGLAELMINAIEHGNLGIDHAEKGRLLEEGQWLQEIESRLTLDEYKHRRAIIEIEVTADSIQAQISDEGWGFEWDRFLQPEMDRVLEGHGRGILIAKNLSFDSLEYMAPGNRVITRCVR